MEMEMVEGFLPLQLRPIQHIPPAPNHVRSAIDWMPNYLGHAWLAYGAATTVVITTTPPPTSEEETQIGPFFQQLLEPSQHHEIRAVAWAPVLPPNGVLAVGAGECIHIYQPNTLGTTDSERLPELPLAWRQIMMLSHTSSVCTVVWTESGDGLLVAGFEVVMWKNREGGWDPFWKSKPEQPHFLASASWSAEGLAATAANSPTCAGAFQSMASTPLAGASKGTVAVWYHSGSLGVQEVELSHPQPVSMIQWRPSKGKSQLECPQRQVLLTCCMDGAVRLWAEFDSGRGRLDKSVGREVADKHLRPVLFVILVIEVNSCMNGVLGMDTSVMWAHETRDEGIGRGTIEVGCFNNIVKGKAVDSCEWLLGVGPNASLAWWSLHCLDDISPPRCPRVHLWKQGTELLSRKLKPPLVGSSAGSQAHSVLVKAVVQRIGSRVTGPPCSADLFELLPESIFSWSHVWNPISAFGADMSVKETKDCEANAIKSPWSTAGEIINAGGHSGNIRQVALHPVNGVQLAASLDYNGLVLFWSLSSIVESQMEIPTLSHPAWKLCGQLLDYKNSSKSTYCFLTWAPIVLKEGQVLLLLGHSQGIDCVLVRKDHGETEMTHQDTSCSIEFPMHLCKQVESIHTILLPVTSAENCICYSFMVIGVGMEGHLIRSWKLGLHVHHNNDICLEHLSGSLQGNSFDVNSHITAEASAICTFEINLAKKVNSISVQTCLPIFRDSNVLDNITCFTVLHEGNSVSLSQHLEGILFGASYKTPGYDFATGDSDGFLKLWKIGNYTESSVAQPHVLEFSCQCVGLIKAHECPVRVIALVNGGSKIATASSITADYGGIVHIWDAESYLAYVQFALEDRIVLPGCVIALDWLVVGNGMQLLALATQNEVLVFSERRYAKETFTKAGEAAKSHIWFCIASVHTASYIKDLFWGPKATLVLVSSKYMFIVSQWSFIGDKGIKNNIFAVELNGEKFARFYSDRGISVAQKSLKDEIHEEASISKSILSSCTIEDVNKCSCITSRANMEHNLLHGKVSLFSILEIAEDIGGALPLYHPRAIFHCLLQGNKKRATASVRHLMMHLSATGLVRNERISTNFGKPSVHIPEMDLYEFLQLELSKGAESDKKLQWGGGTVPSVHAWSHYISSETGEGSLVTKKLSANANEQSEYLSKSEVESFVAVLKKCCWVPGLTEGDKIQLLVLLDLLGEVSDSYQSAQYANLDESARRFWIELRFAQKHFVQTMGRVAAVGELTVDSRKIAWAFQSDCQDILFDLCLSNESSWPAMRALGVGFWFTNVNSLRSRMEKLARAQYLKSKDPKDCALLYLALNRKNVLMGLFKLSKNEKDKPLAGFLARDFQEEKNKAAALKNAYVLMGRHQFELAVAFFLLGDDLASGVSVCVKNLHDEQLALVICRLVEGFNGPLVRDLISKHVLPIAEEKKDHWLASILQWSLGDSIKSFGQLIQPCEVDNACLGSVGIVDAACLDPNIGHYCAMLAMKSSFRASIGDSKAIALARWAIMKASGALKRIGLPLEALECLTSSTSVLLKEGSEDCLNMGDFEYLFGQSGSNKKSVMSNHWVSGSLSSKLESIFKLNLAMQYITKLIQEHPHWESMDSISYELMVATGKGNEQKSQYTVLVEESDRKLTKSLSILEQKFSIKAIDAVDVLANFAYHHGRLFFHCCLAQASMNEEFLRERFRISRSLVTVSIVPTSLPERTAKEICEVLARAVLARGYNVSSWKESFVYSNRLKSSKFDCSYWFPCLKELVNFAYDLKLIASFMTYQGSYSDEEQQKIFSVLDLLILCLHVAIAWLGRHTKALLTLIRCTTKGLADTDSSSVEFNMIECYRHFYSLVYSMEHTAIESSEHDAIQENGKHDESNVWLIPRDDRWRLVGVCLWSHLVSFAKKQLSKLMNEVSGNGYDTVSQVTTKLSSCLTSITDSLGEGDTALVQDKMSPECLGRPMLGALVCICNGLRRQLACHMRHNTNTLHQDPISLWLWGEDSPIEKKAVSSFVVPSSSGKNDSASFDNVSVTYLDQGGNALVTDGKDRDESFEEVWQMLVTRKQVCSVLASEGFRGMQSRSHSDNVDWRHVEKALTFGTVKRDNQTDVESTKEYASKSKPIGATSDSHAALGAKQIMAHKKGNFSICFEKPKEVLRRSGELFEAICVNSCNAEELVVASNHKGLVYLNLSNREPFSEALQNLWSEVDWPRNGWARSESTPVPTFVSPGVGLGSKEGSRLGLGGATVGVGTLPASGKDFKGGGAFGIPGYAGIGAMGLGWGEWEDFEEFVDPPATVENVSTRALASHPLRPLFLVGSSNTHVYLWEFGKVVATATYGVLPAANVPPPYALASVSAVQFDRFGHRFATAALDGTVCAWQLEVGGRSNVRPTESSLCFHQHASDVIFVGASGSIIAATGSSPSGVNMVIWDTLAPPQSSRASCVCHEGGARCLAAFDHDIGGGSISPLIVTGGKSGDVGVHDFRFIATGKTKRQRHFKEENMLPSSPLKGTSCSKEQFCTPIKHGEQSVNGLLWHIPKAHSGSISRVSTIPGTSLFLTGSKDGDVKLWDVKTFELLCHWPKVHDKHTFLQPNSRGFGGVVRAAVTDVQVLPCGFLTCGGDGAVRLFKYTDEIPKA